MGTDRIRIEKITLKNLHDFACQSLTDTAFKETAPISLSRARAQARNPYALPDDVILVLAYVGERCVGYHGLLPGQFLREGNFSQVHWATTFFVAPDFRGRGLGELLIMEILKLNRDFAVTRMTVGAQQAYRKAGLRPLGILRYYQLRVERILGQDPFSQKIIALCQAIRRKPRGSSQSYRQSRGDPTAILRNSSTAPYWNSFRKMCPNSVLRKSLNSTRLFRMQSFSPRRVRCFAGKLQRSTGCCSTDGCYRRTKKNKRSKIIIFPRGATSSAMQPWKFMPPAQTL
ncbi:MAG: GNAT family N-acetyltransferase [Desulfobacterales bacterium]|nr:MAG: GNAT family N-acetyltransferase [Desulfobacterales bacterium]